MDPITLVAAGFKVAELLITFGMKVYDDTPLEIRQKNAAAWGQFVNNIGSTILDWQSQINAALPKAPEKK